MAMNKKLVVSGVAAAILVIAAYGVAQMFLYGDSAVARAEAQYAATPRPVVAAGEGTCASQHQEKPGVATWDLLADGYEIKAAVPGGVWLQKRKDVYYCNSGIVRDDETMCWKIRAPLKGQNCADAISKARAKDLRG
ncbi:hypothetical protein [Reyranella sp.]|uniref:hypothetical protein n=1 Tax=Reyranella sp. TaxID=1929291 RepID=UPI004036DF34